jgi:hypothetical protein
MPSITREPAKILSHKIKLIFLVKRRTANAILIARKIYHASLLLMNVPLLFIKLNTDF